MLSSAVLSVRLGGIYALARLAQDHPAQYHVPIFQLFCAFVRRPPEEGKEAKNEQGSQEKRDKLRPDVQAVMTAISGRSEAGLDYEKATRGLLLETVLSEEGRTVRRKGHYWLDLRGVDLRCVDLLDAELSNANFAHADLSASILLEANLSHAQLRTANLSRAQLWKANLSHADISQRANLSHADLTSANITEALLFLANLSGAILYRANLTGAILQQANLTGANLSKVTGLLQRQLDRCRADPNKPPQLHNAFDAETGEALEWRGKPPSG